MSTDIGILVPPAHLAPSPLRPGLPAVPRFGVLGPLDVVVDGRTVLLGSGQQRTVLAVLLLRANHAVPVDDLAYAIWGDAPPVNPRVSAQTYLSRLRKTFLAMGAGEVIRRRGASYYVTLPESALDLERFRALVRRAEAARATKDLVSEAAALTEALALYRGEPLLDVPSDVLHRDVVPRLVEERMYALERRIDLDLQLGRHAEVIGELTGLTAEHPLRERWWGFLMLALHRSGRQGDAFAAYHRVSRMLAEELGVGPGAELRRLREGLLAE